MGRPRPRPLEGLPQSNTSPMRAQSDVPRNPRAYLDLSTVNFKLPKVNLIGIMSCVLTILSITFPWWGINAFGLSFSWGLFSAPVGTPNSFGSDQFTKAQSEIGLGLIAMILIIATFTIVGSVLERGGNLLWASFGLSVFASILYAWAINVAIQAACQGTSTCINGPIGSANGVVWGFQAGYYLLIAGGVVSLVGGILHEYFVPQLVSVTPTKLILSAGQKLKFCFNCGTALPSMPSKFCPNCANPLT
jgi:hypothetical protein